MEEDLSGWLTETCASGIFATGGQASFCDELGAVDVAAGEHHDGLPVEASDVVEAYCLTKPIVAAAALGCAERAGVDPWAPIGESLPAAKALGDRVSLASIIHHGAGLKWPDAFSWIVSPRNARPGLADLHPESREQHAYSELAGWQLLCAFMEQVAEGPPADVVSNLVTGVMGIDGEVIFDPLAAARAADEGRIIVGRAGLPVDDIPLLHSVTPAFTARASPVSGGLVSARALARFGLALAEALGGRPVAGLPAPELLQEVERTSPGVRDDLTWHRPVAFGFAMETVDRAWSPQSLPSPIRYLGSSITSGFLAIDVEQLRVCAVVLNGVAMSSTDVQAIRAEVVRRMWGR